MLTPDNNAEITPGKYVFIPIGPECCRTLARLFGINYLGPTPNYSGIMKNCNGRPRMIKEITEKRIFLFNSMSYGMSSYETFIWKTRQELCKYIEKDWKCVKRLVWCSEKYKSGKMYIENKGMRKDIVWGGSVEMCALALL